MPDVDDQAHGESGSTSPTGCADHLEPNDTEQNASKLQPSVLYEHLTICPGNDMDRFELEIPKASDFKIEFHQPNLHPKFGNSLVILFDGPSLQSSVSPENRSGTYSTPILHLVPGTYRLTVWSFYAHHNAARDLPASPPPGYSVRFTLQ